MAKEYLVESYFVQRSGKSKKSKWKSINVIDYPYYIVSLYINPTEFYSYELAKSQYSLWKKYRSTKEKFKNKYFGKYRIVKITESTKKTTQEVQALGE